MQHGTPQPPERFREYKRYLWMKAHYENRKCDSHVLRIGLVQRAVLEQMPVIIRKKDMLYGWTVYAEMTDEEKLEHDRLEKWYEDCPKTSGFDIATTGHRVLDYEKLMSKGAEGVLAEIGERLSGIDYTHPDDAEKEAFYTACSEALKGFIRFGERIRQAYAEAARTAEDEETRERCIRLEQVFSQVPAKPARSFYEAMQSTWFLQYASFCFDDYCLTGRPSDYLYPYYRADRDAGLIDDVFAQRMINELYERINDIYGSFPSPVMVGGVNRQGEPVWNELSYMCIQAIEETGRLNPSVSICYRKDIPEELMRLSMDKIAKGYTRPAFFNDDVIIDGLLQAGVAPEDARYYIHSTCVEITPIAASNIHVACPYINLSKAMEMVLNNGRAIWGAEEELTAPLDLQTDSLTTFEKFYDAVVRAVSGLIRAAVAMDCRRAEYNRRYTASPLSSCFQNDCILRGKDTAAGGTRYNYYYPCFPGFINLIDSVAAVRKAVYEDGVMTLRELRDLLAADFEGGERMRQYLLNRCPKFGNDDEATDEIGKRLFDMIRSDLAGYHVWHPNGDFHPSYFAYIMHGRLGRVASASPDGRKQGTAVSESLGAAQGRDKNGPLAVIRSISKIDQTWGIGGIATNFRFSKSLMKTEEGRQAVTELVHTFMAERNFECQFNVVDQATLLDAKQNPEKHRNLLVRVAGYSDYFVNLDPVIQDEIISRTEHESV